MVVLGINVGAALKQPLDHLGVAKRGCKVERRPSVLAALVYRYT